MKKLLSVLLAVIMLFGTLSIAASAANPITDINVATSKKDTVASSDLNGDRTYVVIRYKLNGFTVKNAFWTYDVDSNKFAYVEGIKTDFYQIPQDTETLYVGTQFMLPEVTPPEGKQFNGWKCTANDQTFAAGTPETIKADMIMPNTSNLIEFSVVWGNAEPEDDTLGNIMGILAKVFGAIIGILFYNGNTAKGVEMVQGILGGLSL